MPANATPTLRSGRVAAAAIPAYAPVKADGNPAAAGEAIIGIAEAAAASGKRLSVVVDGSAEAWAGAAINDGDLLQVGANSTVVPLASGVCIGRALNAAATGDKVEVLLAAAVTPAAVAAALTGTKRMIAQTLVSAYEAERRIVDQYGSYMLRRSGKLASADIPSSITASATAPASDADMSGKTVKNLCLSGLGSSRGVTDVTITSAAEKAALQLWIKGFNPALRVRWYYNAYRLSNSIGPRTGNGNQDTDVNSTLSTGLAINNNGVFFDAEFTGDIFFMSAGGSDTKFYIWVNDCLLTSADLAAGAGITASQPDAASNNMAYGPSGSGRVYVKLKWATAAKRRIRIAQVSNSGIGDFWYNAIYTMSPVTQRPINWLHIGDSFSTGALGYSGLHGMMHFLTAEFGAANINLINAAEGATGYLANSSAAKYNFVERWALDLPYNNTPDVVTCWAGTNDLGTAFGANATTLLQSAIAKWPNALPVLYGINPSKGSINASVGSRDIDGEAVLASVASSLASSGLVYVPVQLDPAGAWMSGTGYVSATTGAGNTDIYTSSDQTHPSPLGHQYLGQRGARELYNALRRQLIGY